MRVKILHLVLPFVLGTTLSALDQSAQHSVPGDFDANHGQGPLSGPAALAAAAANTAAVALDFRKELVSGVKEGREDAVHALVRLKAHASPGAFKKDHDADCGFAAMDVAQRLLAERKLALAEVFFREAETSLTKVIANTTDANAGDKVMYLQARAYIRGRFLGRAADAKVDLDRAASLQPDNVHLKRARDATSHEHAEVFTQRFLQAHQN